MSHLFKAGLVAVSLMVFCVADAEACRRMRRNGCQPAGCQAIANCCQSYSDICQMLKSQPRSDQDCLDDKGNKLAKGWYWQEYRFSDGKIYKHGPFADEDTCKKNMDANCPSPSCCPNKDPYYCTGE